jgi:3-isopropylmalate/(R)-2-methylmalate dehydratase large subunit
MGPRAKTLFDKIWEDHVVKAEPGFPSVLYIDLHLIHEATSPVAFTGLRRRGLKVRRPDRTLATVDHLISTGDRSRSIGDAQAVEMIDALDQASKEFGIPLYGVGSEYQGIVHVIGPELGFSRPGMTIVCGDSHTSTHGALGALAFGIGTTEVEHVLATQCLLQKRPGNYEVRFEGKLDKGVTAKDMVLALIAKIGIGGGTEHVFEYRGSLAKKLSMEERLTVCNMSIEAGARAGMFAPDDTTFQYVARRPFGPKGKELERSIEAWRGLATEPRARFDKTVTIDADHLDPMITYGTNPSMAIPIRDCVPHPEEESDPAKRAGLEQALEYMGVRPGKPLLGQRLDVVFIGSCTNSRLSDLREAAMFLKGRKVAVRTLVVPGSQQVKRAAEAEGLDAIFKGAGAEWREPGCSMCIAMNGDLVHSGRRSVSTSNRNFEGRQGKGSRTHLASPLTAAACAVKGSIADPRELL